MIEFQPHAIVWDLDGTLVDSAPDLATALNTVLDMRGFFTLSVDEVRPMIGNGVAKLVERGFNAVGMRLQAPHLNDLVDMFVAQYRQCATQRTRPYPGIVETLQAIHALNIPMGVCTNKPESLSRQILNELGLAGFFNSVIGGDTTSARKPDPLPVQTCLQELVSAPENSLVIGDSVHDVHAAKAAGATVAVVPWGYRSAPVDELGADFILDDLATLAGVLCYAGKAMQQTAH